MLVGASWMEAFKDCCLDVGLDIYLSLAAWNYCGHVNAGKKGGQLQKVQALRFQSSVFG